MTEQEKFLLIKDLCARLPYNLVINCTEEDDEKTNFNCFLAPDMIKDIKSETAYWTIKPYLRPMSSMTEEERLYFHRNSAKVQILVDEEKTITKSFYGYTTHLFDWLNKKGFDYRGLIPKGLALEAPKDMYQ